MPLPIFTPVPTIAAPPARKHKLVMILPPAPFLLDDRAFLMLGPLQIAAVARDIAGWDVRVLDLTGHARRCARPRHDRCTDEILAYVDREVPPAVQGADLVGIYGTGWLMPGVYRALAAVKALGKDAPPVVLGGPHANTTVPPEFDYVVAGDQGGGGGEPAFLEVLRRVQGGDSGKGVVRVESRDSSEYPNDRWPYPARDLVDVESYRYFIDGERATHIVSQAGCPFACNFAFAGDGLVATERGFISIATLHASAQVDVYAACGHGHAIPVRGHGLSIAASDAQAICSVTQALGKRRCVRLATENGLEVVVDVEHTTRVFRSGAVLEIPAQDVRLGDWMPVRYGANVWPTEMVRFDVGPARIPLLGRGRPPKQPHLPNLLDEDLAWWLGFIVGDGSIYEEHHTTMRVHVDLMTRVRELNARLFGEPGVIDTSGNQVAPNVVLSSVVIGRWLRCVIGLNPADKLRVPECVLRSPRSVALAFVDGLYTADGHEADGARTITSISPRLLREVAAIHVNAGFVPSMRPRESAEQAQSEGHAQRFILTLHIRRRRWPLLVGPKYERAGSQQAHWVRESTARREYADHPLVARPDVCWFPVTAIEDVGQHDVYGLTADGTVTVNGLLLPQCAHWRGYRKLVPRSLTHIEGELRQLVGQGYHAIMEYSDEVNLYPDFDGWMSLLQRVGIRRWRGFFKAGKKVQSEDMIRRMAESGCHQVCVGAESGSPRILARVGKGATVEDNTNFVRWCVKHGIAPKCFIQVGLTGDESWETVQETRDWLVAMAGEGLRHIDVAITTPFEGTPIREHPERWGLRWNEAELQRAVRDGWGRGRPGEYVSYIETHHLSRADLVQARLWLDEEFAKAAGIAGEIKDDG